MKLSDEELSRWIAEKLEPKPPKYNYHKRFITTRDRRSDVWTFSYTDQDWHPRGMVNDPAMTLKLLTWLGNNVSGFWDKLNWSTQKELQRAVAEAWALANGYKES